MAFPEKEIQKRYSYAIVKNNDFIVTRNLKKTDFEHKFKFY